MNLTHANVQAAIAANNVNLLRKYWNENPQAVNDYPSRIPSIRRSPLMLAITLNKSDIVDLCLSMPAINVNAISPEGQCTALSLAIEKDSASIVEKLIAAGAWFDIPNSSVLMHVVENDALETLDLLIACDHILEVNKPYEGLTALAKAVNDQNYAMVEKLLKIPGVDPNVELFTTLGRMSLLCYGITRAPKIAELLLKTGEINTNGLDTKGHSLFLKALDLHQSQLIPLFLNKQDLNIANCEKGFLLKKILALPNKEVVKTVLKQAIDPKTILGAHFWKANSFTPCSLDKGTLKQICDQLKVLDPSFIVEIDPAKTFSHFFKKKTQVVEDNEIELAPFDVNQQDDDWVVVRK